ncbi:hypothetical protein [Archangium sp.]|uniref:hypothetical protein n=1 Tax=Archangium sp. TaxID=1872627 RepID=UPI00286BD191|nr:hypothetical protein [Archangium sp.]
MRLWVWGLVGLTVFTATATATPEPGPRGRPPHLLGHLPDGCELLPISDAASIVGRPLEFDAFMLLEGRTGGWVNCAYTERATFFPKRPRYQVSFRLSQRDPGREADLRFLGLAPLPGGAGDVRWRSNDADDGVLVRTFSSHGMDIVVTVALREPPRGVGRIEAELDLAYRLALQLRTRAQALSLEEMYLRREASRAPRPHPEPVPWGPCPDVEEVVSWSGKFPAAPEWHATLEPVHFLRGRFGTRVQVIVSDDGYGSDGEAPEEVLKARERALETGREDDSPRRDGALVFVDLASQRAWFRFGPGAPKLTLPDGRPFPNEWHGPDLQARSKGKGTVLRLKALMDAYVRAYAALGITGPPELPHARPPLPKRNVRVAVAPPPDLSLKNAWTPWTNPSFATLDSKPQSGPCALVPLPEAASLLGLPLELDAPPRHGSRDGDPLSCVYSGRGTRSPKRPRYEVELQVARQLPEPERWQPIPGEPEGRRWRVEKNDRGVSVAATTAHGVSVVARVARRDVSLVYSRTELELLTAYHFTRLLSLRAQEFTAIP